MLKRFSLFSLAILTLLAAVPLTAAERSGYGLTVVVDESPRPEYPSGGTVYIEAVRDREYSLRITNPLSCRVAVALSVDGLNTINAKRTDPRSAPKWVLGPYESVTISGWQINGSEARKFYFTGEKQSYGAWLGQTDNLGIIEAVFFKEIVPEPRPVPYEGGPYSRNDAPSSRQESSKSAGASGAVPPASAERAQPSLSDDYAATGIGRRVDHDVETVHLDLERRPSAVVRVRYEFRPQLVKLGLLPTPRPCPDPLDRREHASGFSGSYCPDPFAGRP
jgi:hypothetical protein